MIHKNFDDALMNSAYLSELWAVNDLLRLKLSFPEFWSSENEKQLQDEIRHAGMILNELKKNKSLVVKSTQFSMQERIYKKFFDLSKTDKFADTLAVHSMTEHRAVWIYKTYRKLGLNPSYRKLAEVIKNDEKGHFDIIENSIATLDHSPFLFYALSRIDSYIFNVFLVEKYGRLLFTSKQFWTDYYEGADQTTEAYKDSANLFSK
jgi:rubrerythrin